MTPTDHRAARFPVSVKGVVCIGGRFALLKNEREEWELPGGKLESGEDPALCLAREIREELSIDVAVEQLLDCWLYQVAPAIEVVIVTYATLHAGHAEPRVSHEHKELRLFSAQELQELRMPQGYLRSIRHWQALHCPSR
jgi:8-oxo-dGTP pyrophosphatase MutT (NUDIX family)